MSARRFKEASLVPLREERAAAVLRAVAILTGALLFLPPAGEALAGAPTIVAAQIIGTPIVGCRTQPAIVAVVSDSDGDATSVGGQALQSGLPVGSVKLRPSASAPPGADGLPPGQIFVGVLRRLRNPVPGPIEFDLTASDRARNVSPTFPLASNLLPNAPPTLENLELSGTRFAAGVRAILTAHANVSDDCGLGRVSIELDQGDGRGFRSIGSLSDRGRNGDETAGDGRWGGTGKLGFRVPGTFPVRVRAQDTLGLATTSVPVNLEVDDNSNNISGTIHAGDATFADGDVNDPAAPYVYNDDLTSAQDIPNPVTVGGYVNRPGFGPPGPSWFVGDTDDFFRVQLAAGQSIDLVIGDDPAQVDLDLCLYDVLGSLVDCSLGTGAVESLTAPSSGTFYVDVFPDDLCDCGSTYGLTIGQALSADSRDRGPRLTDDFVPGQAIVTLRPSTLPSLGTMTARSYAATLGMSGIAGVPDREMLVTLGSEAQTAGALRALGVEPSRRAMHERARDLPPERRQALDTLLALKALRRRPEVALAEPNYVRRSLFVPNDPLEGSQWHYALLHLPLAWDLTTGSSDVTVAVVDTGVLLGHPDLQGQLVSGYDFISSATRARDGNGIDPDPNDSGDRQGGGSSSFHGTHVAGTIAAASNNGVGVAGVAGGVRVMPVRVLGVGGGTSYDILQGLRFAARMPNDSGTIPSRRADVINLSLGGGSYLQQEQNLYTILRNAGIIVVAAAGNSSSSVPSYPAAYDGVISVSAVDFNGNLSYYSNFGPTIDVAAPGGDLSSDRNGDGIGDGVLSTCGDDSSGTTLFNYVYYQGTSMAAPHVAGVAALMKSLAPAMTPAQLDGFLAGGTITEDRGSPGRDDSYGYGLIDARAAVVAAQTLGGGPPPDQNPSLSVNPPALNLGASLTEAVLQASNAGGGSLQVTDVTENSGGWLSVAPTGVDANGLGTYWVTVDRSGLANGTYNAMITFASTANPASVSVVMNVGSSVPAGVGFLYVLLVDPVTLRTIAGAPAGPSAASYPYAFNGAPSGDYYLVAGSDMDNDGYICDSGEACGAYPTLDILSPLSVHSDLSGLDFVAQFLVAAPPAALHATSGFALPAGGLRRTPVTAPTRKSFGGR